VKKLCGGVERTKDEEWRKDDRGKSPVQIVARLWIDDPACGNWRSRKWGDASNRDINRLTEFLYMPLSHQGQDYFKKNLYVVAGGLERGHTGNYGKQEKSLAFTFAGEY